MRRLRPLHPDCQPRHDPQLGFWSAVLATIFSITYDVGQLAEWLGMLGSGGGPENASTPLGLVVLLTASLFLGTAFLLLLVSVHQLASLDKRVWSHAAVVFGTAYTVLISRPDVAGATLRSQRGLAHLRRPYSRRGRPVRKG